MPWDEIGRVMGEEITGSAVIQHLAKTRARMIGRGLEVPPPLRRGGGSSRVPATGTSTAPATATTGRKSSFKAKPKAKSAPRKAKKATKKGNDSSDDSSSDDDEWKDDDSDAEYGEPAVKRGKTTKGAMKRKIKTEDSDDEEAPLSKAAKYGASDFKPGEERSAFGHTDINGVPIDDDMETEDEFGDEVVGTGQPWLDLDEDQYNSTTAKKTPVKKSLLVSLPTTPAKMEVSKAGDQENHMFGNIQSGFEDYQVEDHKTFSDPFTNDSTMGFVDTNGYGGGYGNDGGYGGHDFNQDGAFTGSFANDGGFDANVPNAFGTDMTGGGTISDAYNLGRGNTVPYPIQTNWPASHYTTVNQTPADPSAGPDFNGGYFEDNQFDMGTFDDGGYSFAANNDNLFNADDVDGNFISDDFFSSNNYGN